MMHMKRFTLSIRTELSGQVYFQGCHQRIIVDKMAKFFGTLNVSIFIGCRIGNPFMLNTQIDTAFFKMMTDKLWPIVASDD